MKKTPSGKFMTITLVILVIVVWGALHLIFGRDASPTVIYDYSKYEPHSYQVADLPDTEGISPLEYLDAIEEISPKNGIKPPVESFYDPKCIATMNFQYETNNKQQNTTWDVFTFVSDGIPGIWIVNSKGNSITCFGHYFHNLIQNHHICVKDWNSDSEILIRISPEGDELENFSIIT